MIITSSANEQIKSIRKLRERKYRNESGTYYIEGIRIVLEALAQPEQVKTLLYAPELMESQLAAEAVQKAVAAGVKMLEVSASVFETFSLKEGPMGLAAVVTQNWQTLTQLKPEQMGLWVGLDSVADPGNLGTIMRTADAVGASGIFLLDHCTDPYDPAAIRASMGAIFSLQLVKLTSADFLSDLVVVANVKSKSFTASYNASGVNLLISLDSAGNLPLNLSNFFKSSVTL